jgi:hypothetical protein
MSDELKPVAWLCEFVQEDGTTKTQIVQQDPDGIRWNDGGEPSPYRTTALYRGEPIQALVCEMCNAVMTGALRKTPAVEAAFMNSTGDRGKYPNALDTLASWAA